MRLRRGLPLHLQLSLCEPLHLRLGATLRSRSSGGALALPEAMVLQSCASKQRIIVGFVLPDDAVAHAFF
jgi:hypothetical protein